MIQNKETKQITRNFRTKENKIGYLVQRAYFQSKGRFFKTEQFKNADIKEAERSLGITTACDISRYSDKTAHSHRQLILEQHSWQPFNSESKSNLESLARIHSKEQLKMEDTLFSLLEHCWRNKIEIPPYNTLEIIVVDAYEKFLQKTLDALESNITDHQCSTLLAFIDHPDITPNFTKIKRINQKTNQRSLIDNADILSLFRETFYVILPLLNKLCLSTQAIQEISKWIYNSNITQIRRLKNKHLLLLRLAAFVQDQFFLRQDHAVDAILKKIKSTVNGARGHDRKHRESLQEKIHEANKSVINSAKNANGVINTIGRISKDISQSLPERNEKVINLVDNYFEAIDPSFDDKVAKIEFEIESRNNNSNYYDYIFNSSSTLIKSLLPLVKVISFDPESKNQDILDAIDNIQGGNFNFSKSTPTSFIKNKDLAAFEKEDDIPQVTKYKVLLISHINDCIRNRMLTLKYSYRFLADENFWIPEDEWKNHKNEIIFSTGLTNFVDGKSIVDKIGCELTKSYKSLNDNLDKNDFVVVGGNSGWKTKRDEADYSASEYIPKLLSDGSSRTLYEMLSEIDTYTGFSDSFRNYQVKNAKQSIDKKLIFAALMSLGTNIGHTDMAKASKNISVKQLRDTEQLWFETDNIKKANETVVKFIQRLPLPTIFNDHNDLLHTSSDGKKVVVAVDSLLANYSYKYYGKDQGVTVNSFVDTKQSFFHVNVLTSSDREAAYMMDGLAKTKKSLFSEREDELDLEVFKSHKHSTDTNGYTDAIFAGLHLLDVSFAPRLTNLHDRALYSYDNKSLLKNSKYTVGPKTAINKTRILDNWDDILRLMATIKSGKQSASLIFRRLSASKKASDLYKAIKELGQLLRSHYIVNYLKNEELRRSVQKQLNRVELGQRFSSALFFARKGELRVGGQTDIERVMLCKTLLKNVVILWNYLYLSDYIISLDSGNEIENVLESISSGSVISWRHVNMHGVYDFDHKPIKSFKASIRQMQSLKL